MKRLLGLVIAVFGIFANPLLANDRIVLGGLDGLDPYERRAIYPVCLAISGGGARGLATIGVLRAFEEKGIVVRALAGTSMGGVIGGLYSCGYSPDELADLLSDLDFSELYTNRPSRKSMFLTKRQDRDRRLLSIRFRGFSPVIPQGLTAGQRLTSLLTDLTTRGNYLCGGEFERLPIPFKTVGTDILSGREIVLDSGSIADAMRATMAFPLAFTGVERDGMIVMDGGIVTPIPVRLVGQMCDSVDFVVALNTASSLRPKNELVTPVDIANQVTTIMTADRMRDQLEQADFVIQPPIDAFASTDFADRDKLLEIGYRTGLTAADSIIGILSKRTQTVRYRITAIEVDSQSTSSGITYTTALQNGVRSYSRQELIDEFKNFARRERLYRLEINLIQVSRTVSEDSEINGRDSLIVSEVRDINLRLSAKRSNNSARMRVVFEGNEFVPDSVLANRLSTVPPDRFSARWLRQAIDSILAYYYEREFDLVTVRKIEIDDSLGVVILHIDEGIIRRIDVRDNPNTKGWYVTSHFPLKVGQPYSTKAAGQGISNIYATDLFEKVTVDLTPFKGGTVVTLRVTEREFNQLRFGWHWDDEYHSEELLEVIKDNIGGMGIELALHGRYAPDRQEYFARIKADRIFQTYLTGRLRIFQERINRQLYAQSEAISAERHERKTGAEVQLGQQIARLGTVTATLQASQVKYVDDQFQFTERFDLRMLRFASLVETFDRFPFPTAGKRYEFALDFAGEVLGGEVEFTRFYASLESYWSLGSFLNYHPRLEMGLSRSGLPPTERFHLGGLHSFAGFRKDQLAGDKMVVFSNELRLGLPLRLYITARHDMGEAYESSDQIKLRNLRHGFGLSLAHDSWIGPMEIGYGIVDSDIDKVYVNVGFTF